MCNTGYFYAVDSEKYVSLNNTQTDCIVVFQLQQSLRKEAIIRYTTLPILLTQSSPNLASVALSNLLCITSKFYSWCSLTRFSFYRYTWYSPILPLCLHHGDVIYILSLRLITFSPYPIASNSQS